MNVVEAGIIAYSLMDEHGFNMFNGWELRFSNRRRDFGRCYIRSKRIELSRPVVQVNDRNGVREIVLHEIAHALRGSHLHDAKWKRIAISIGASGSVHPTMLVSPPGDWRLLCASCGYIAEMYRQKDDRRRSCPRCSKGRSRQFDPRYEMVEVRA